MALPAAVCRSGHRILSKPVCYKPLSLRKSGPSSSILQQRLLAAPSLIPRHRSSLARCQSQSNGSSDSSASTSSSSSTKTSKKPQDPNSSDDEDEDEQVDEESLWQYFVLLMTEYGGLYGTAAVILAYFTKIDAFGNFHWSLEDITTGLLFFIPVLVMDAVIMLPDYSPKRQEAQMMLRGMLGKDTLEQLQALNDVFGARQAEQADASSSSASATSATASAASTASSATAEKPAQAGSRAAAAGSSSAPLVDSGVSGEIASQFASEDLAAELTPSAWEFTVAQLRGALSACQKVNLSTNPTIVLSPLAEFGVVLVASLADAMLYRAVFLVLFGYWLRDRMYEAGADDVLTIFGTTMATEDWAKWLALGVGAVSGAAIYGVRAWQESNASVVVKVVAPELEKEHSELTETMRERVLQNMKQQNALLYSIEGTREVFQVVASGASFLLTNNLAASFVGNVILQSLFSVYQRIVAIRIVEEQEAAFDAFAEKVQQEMANMQDVEVTPVKRSSADRLESLMQELTQQKDAQSEEDLYTSIFGKPSESDSKSKGSTNGSASQGTDAEDEQRQANGKQVDANAARSTSASSGQSTKNGKQGG